MRKLLEVNKTGLTCSDGTTVFDFHSQDCCEAVPPNMFMLIGGRLLKTPQYLKIGII